MGCSEMEMERINENTIRVSIANEDLEERGIRVLDLLGNQKEIENFFYSILEEVDIDNQFQENDSITFQVLPNYDGLELFISKSNIINPPTDMNSYMENQVDEFTDFLKNHIVSQEEDQDISVEVLDENDIYADESVSKDMVFRANDFEDLIELSNVINMSHATTNLYQYQSAYFLVVTFYLEDISKSQVKNDISKLYEFLMKTPVTKDILEEYGQSIIEDNALNLLSFYFKP
ncbi:adaptor protein MecA [Vagococcus jeotgali]|uniref:adaptor protein MecA n=1 Tax=Vagococcus jeotgali TaxID=3109030 RepID=UPI002DDB48EE|nr:adaptor protein MecA [Vagococcus sp. B2T-5]